MTGMLLAPAVPPSDTLPSSRIERRYQPAARRPGHRTSTLVFRPDIEGLRGIAVLLVVAFHCGIPIACGGFIGVDVFFVLSGYLITGLLVAEVEATSRLNLLQFYARRVRRLLPASALSLVVTLLIGALVLAPQELEFAGRAARASSGYMSNIFFARNAADYFSPDAEANPLLHTWSLAVEEQFYLFWPLLILLGLRFWRSRKALVAVLTALTALSLAASVWFTPKSASFAFYALPTRTWEFGIGGLAVLLPRGSPKLPASCWRVLGWFGVIAILASGVWFISRQSAFPGWMALLPVLGTVITLVAIAQQPEGGASAVLGAAPVQILGKLSYSWYLWHWPLLVFASALVPNIAIPGKTAVAALALAVAALVHQFVENPIRYHPALVARPVWTLFLAAVVSACTLGIACLSLRLAAHLAHEPQMQAITAAVEDIADLPRLQCVSQAESAEVKTCVFGNASSTVNIALLGDSHAIQWFNPLRQMVELHHWRLTTFVKSGCPATDITPQGVSAGFASACSQWRAGVIRQILSLRPSLVFYGDASVYVGRKDRPSPHSGTSLNQWQAGVRRTLEALTATGLRVAVMRDNPLPGFDIPTCLARSLRHPWYPGGACEMEKTTSLDATLFEAEKSSARGLVTVRFIDLTEHFCHADVCGAMQQGTVMYRDDNHLTGSFAGSLRPALEAELLLSLQPADGLSPQTADGSPPKALTRNSVAPHEYPTPKPTSITTAPGRNRPSLAACLSAIGIVEETVFPQWLIARTNFSGGSFINLRRCSSMYLLAW